MKPEQKLEVSKMTDLKNFVAMLASSEKEFIKKTLFNEYSDHTIKIRGYEVEIKVEYPEIQGIIFEFSASGNLTDCRIRGKLKAFNEF